MIQRSRNKNRAASNFNENMIVDDIRELISISNNSGPVGIYMNGFRVTGCIAENVVLPSNANLEYDGPLSMCSGYTITVPSGTTLTIL